MASKTKATAQKEEAPEKETSEGPDSPLLDLSDAAVRKMIKLAKKRGWVTHDQINAVLPSEEVTSDQIEDVFAMLNEMGINVIEQEEAEAEQADGEAREEEEDDEPAGGDTDLVEVTRAVPVKAETKEPTERTDDPVRMYLREMGSVELLSREGEIAIAKRIEAGRELRAVMAVLIAAPISALGSTMKGSEPPSSMTLFLMCLPACSATLEPAPSDPVSVTALTRSSAITRAMRPGLMSKVWNAPSGKPARRKMSSRASAQRDTLEACLRRPTLPAIRAGAAKRTTCQDGKFHGMMARTGPNGR